MISGPASTALPYWRRGAPGDGGERSSAGPNATCIPSRSPSHAAWSTNPLRAE